MEEEANIQTAVLQNVQKDTKIYKLLKLLLSNPQGMTRTSIIETLKIDNKSLLNLLHYLTHVKKMKIEKNDMYIKLVKNDIEITQSQVTQPQGKRVYLTGSNINRFKQLLESNFQGISIKDISSRLGLPISSVYGLANRLRQKGFVIKLENDLYMLQPYSNSSLVVQDKHISSGIGMQTKLGKELDKLPDPQHIINKLSDIPISEQKDALHHLKHGIFNFRVVQAILDSNSFVKDLEIELKKGWIE